MSDRRRTYGSEEETGNNIGIVADFIIRISKTESDPSKMITVDGDPTPLLNGFRRCLAKSTEDNKINICYLDDSDSNYYENGESAILTGAEGDVFVYFPEFFYKGTDTGSEWVFNITTTQVDKDSYQDLGWHYAPASLVGAYPDSGNGYINSKMYSQSHKKVSSGVELENETRPTSSRIRGAGFHIMDYQQHCVIAWMFYAKYKSTDASNICGTTVTNDGWKGHYTGTTDKLGMTDSTRDFIGKKASEVMPNEFPPSFYNDTYTYTQINFLGLESCWGQYDEQIEGIHVYAVKNSSSKLDINLLVYDKDFHINDKFDTLINPNKRLYTFSNIDPNNSSGYIKSIKGGKYMDIISDDDYIVDKYSLEWDTYSDKYFCDYFDISSVRSNNPCTAFRGGGRSTTGSWLPGVSFLCFENYYPSSSYYKIARLAFDGEITVIESPTEFKAITEFR